MHRKFIALIVSAAVAVTGISLVAAPARADETARVLAGIAALALLGAALQSSRAKATVEMTTTTPGWKPPSPGHGPSHMRPPRQAARFVLPQYCLLPTPRYQGGSALMGERCLYRHYGPKRTAQLPAQCRATFWNGRKWRSGYDPTCLRGKGYVIRR